ncbi:rhomboid family intramembrane serine protease [Desulfovibrio inopinatus]|uniref:rhomboid family intramembrane serine protease n=1 Tax=Desulfovibrio inopinatus TaxID=102109 RepID=UPI0004184784|nr:rhomboid family intramembrane serine protease [Desulfovibrio inopinatus]
MIPLKANIPRHTPALVTWVIFLGNVLVFFWQLRLPTAYQTALIYHYGLVPARLSDRTWAIMSGYTSSGVETFFTYMFLHGSIWHFALNMWVLWIFARNIEDVLGHTRFALFYLGTGIAASILHFIVDPLSTSPIIGASGAIAGVMGAYMRLFPHARVVTLIPIFIFPWIVEVPALLFLGIWFFIQIASGFAEWASTGQSGGGVAWWAHVGGFAAGWLLIFVFSRGRPCRYCYIADRKHYEKTT